MWTVGMRRHFNFCRTTLKSRKQFRGGKSALDALLDAVMHKPQVPALAPTVSLRGSVFFERHRQKLLVTTLARGNQQKLTPVSIMQGDTCPPINE